MTFFLILLSICFYCFGRPSIERFLANTVTFEESVEENEKLRPPVTGVVISQFVLRIAIYQSLCATLASALTTCYYSFKHQQSATKAHTFHLSLRCHFNSCHRGVYFTIGVENHHISLSVCHLSFGTDGLPL